MNAPIKDPVVPSEEDLPAGTSLSGDQFTITESLSAGGFGITYKAKDNVLGRTIVVKECFPEDVCLRQGKTVKAVNDTQGKQFRSIVNMFMREAQSLAQLRHPNIVGVHRAFEENETAYMVLDLIDGPDLLDLLEKDPNQLSPDRVKAILLPLLDAIEEVHDIDLLHRDISPDNIIVEKNGTPVLIDFGAARGDASRRTRAVSSLLVVKDGYSPQEFYVPGSVQTPSSDLYALGATFYHVISGKAPHNSQARMMEIAGQNDDPCQPLEGRIEGYDPEFLRAIDMTMRIHPDERLQSARQWREMITKDETEAPSIKASKSKPPAKKEDLSLETSLSQLIEETNEVVRKSRMIPAAPVEPVTQSTPKTTSKTPDWVQEFNAESETQAIEEEAEKAEARATGSIRPSRPTSRNVSRPRPNTLEPVRDEKEVNWVTLAKEKQNSLHDDQYTDVKPPKVKERSKADALLSLGKETNVAKPEKVEDGKGTMIRYLAAGIFLGLMLIFGFGWIVGGG